MLAMLAAFGPFCTDLYLPALPAITRELNTDAAAIQLTLTTSFLGLALGQLFIGPLSDAYGRKRQQRWGKTARTVPPTKCAVVIAKNSAGGGCLVCTSDGTREVIRLLQRHELAVIMGKCFA